jgi:25S rRNA (adenine2142-N1)-methyltransferase
MSRKASRALINKHHQLEKSRHQAAAKGDIEAEAKIAAELADLGGLDHYQQASLQGQSNDRGGDTSKLLLEWLPMPEIRALGQPLKMLEVGALSTRNACSTSGLFDMVHIDLNSQEPGIQKQDFMERPIPEHNAERFDMISLSLVLNFVPDAARRGEMLLRTLSFLRPAITTTTTTAEELLPSLFLVLPRSCVDNSRYFTDARLEELMALLGYAKIRTKSTQKLAYSLWRRASPARTGATDFTKKEVNPGRTRNNFCVTLKRSTDPAT